MKIAISHTRYSYVGGVEKYIYSLVERLLDAGHEVHYFCHFWEPNADPRIRFHKVPNPFKPIRSLKVWSFDRLSERAIAKENFDVIHGFTKTSRQDIYTDGSGCLLDYQEYTLSDSDSGSSFAQSLRRNSLHQRQIERIERARFTRGNFQRIVAMSRLAQQQIVTRYGLSEDEVPVIYNGVDYQNFNPEKTRNRREPMREQLNYLEKDFVVLLIANDYQRKGLRTLIEAADIIEKRGGLPNGRRLQVAVVGKERHTREQVLYKLVKELGLYQRVRFFGPQREIPEWHAMSDLHALPSRFDIFGNVVLEAMAMGIPALVSKKAGAAEVVVDGETGFTFDDPKDSQAWADRIIECAADPKRYEAMCEASRVEAVKYSWDRHFEQMLEIYKEIAVGKKAEQPAA